MFRGGHHSSSHRHGHHEHRQGHGFAHQPRAPPYWHSIWRAIRLKHTIVPRILPVIAASTLWTSLIVMLHKSGVVPFVFFEDKLISMLGIALAFLLAFRTNRGFDRYWQAAQLWTSLSIQSRNLSRLIWNGVQEPTPRHRIEKLQMVRMVLAVAVATKCALRTGIAGDRERAQQRQQRRLKRALRKNGLTHGQHNHHHNQQQQSFDQSDTESLRATPASFASSTSTSPLSRIPPDIDEEVAQLLPVNYFDVATWRQSMVVVPETRGDQPATGSGTIMAGATVQGNLVQDISATSDSYSADSTVSENDDCAYGEAATPRANTMSVGPGGSGLHMLQQQNLESRMDASSLRKRHTPDAREPSPMPDHRQGTPKSSSAASSRRGSLALHSQDWPSASANGTVHAVAPRRSQRLRMRAESQQAMSDPAHVPAVVIDRNEAIARQTPPRLASRSTLRVILHQSHFGPDPHSAPLYQLADHNLTLGGSSHSFSSFESDFDNAQAAPLSVTDHLAAPRFSTASLEGTAASPAESHPGSPADPVTTPATSPMRRFPMYDQNGYMVINTPLDIIHRVGFYIRRQRQSHLVDPDDVPSMTQAVNTIIDSVTKFEQILNVPIPSSYDVHMKQILIIYFAALPFQLSRTLGWAVILIAMVVSFAFFGADAIASEIEEPFGFDENDLPLDYFCTRLKGDIEYIIEGPLLDNDET
ncbi:Bestrophin, RFP-TM, chloride channel-domain-containing protein [Entophlyctis helioformis]|nr:Bestrophin, RFP-TM, chloride channel-domain-containing protein [Entophlyctis helioformis]